MDLKAALSAAVGRLAAENVPSARMNAELLLMFTLGCGRAYLYAHPERELSREESERYEEALDQRASGVPAQYITGHQEFWGMDLIVSPAVLIPRPETEHVVETVLQLAHAPREDARPASKNLRIVDVGTGSGCVALALAKELPEAEIYATDISLEALKLARANAVRLQLADRVDFYEADLMNGLPVLGIDFVVSNPPYVGECEEDQVQLEVRKFEPRGAVFSGPTGLEVIEGLVGQAHAALKPGGWLVFEISGTIAPAVKQLLDTWQGVQIIDDLQGIARVAVAQKPAEISG